MGSEPFLPDVKLNVPVVGGDLAVFQYGPLGGRPILLFHGVTSSNRAWQWFADVLVPRGFTLYAVDLRGRGDSNALPGPFGFAVHAQDAATVIDYLGFKQIDVVGHSMGAFVAVALQGYAAGRISHTVLIDGGISFPLPEGISVAQVLEYLLGPALTRLSMTFESREAYREYWKSQPAFAKGWNAALDEYVDYDLRGTAPLLRASTNAVAVEEDSADQFGKELIENSLKNLEKEVLMLRAVRGLQDQEIPLYPEEILRETLTKYPKIKLVTVPDTNHYDILLSDYGAQACANLIYGSI